jgi:hypothetical protein
VRSKSQHEVVQSRGAQALPVQTWQQRRKTTETTVSAFEPIFRCFPEAGASPRKAYRPFDTRFVSPQNKLALRREEITVSAFGIKEPLPECLLVANVSALSHLLPDVL